MSLQLPSRRNDYSWRAVRVTYGGVRIPGLTQIRYTTEQRITEIYGESVFPTSIQLGNVMFYGEIGMRQSQMILIENLLANPRRSLVGVCVDVTVTYQPEEGIDVNTGLTPSLIKQGVDLITQTRMDKMFGVFASRVEKSFAQDQDAMDIVVPFRALAICNGVALL